VNELEEYVHQIHKLPDAELRAFEARCEAENPSDAKQPRLFAFHLWWTLREIKREWERRGN
jgi:hypothetical protein